MRRWKEGVGGDIKERKLVSLHVTQRWKQDRRKDKKKLFLNNCLMYQTLCMFDQKSRYKGVQISLPPTSSTISIVWKWSWKWGSLKSLFTDWAQTNTRYWLARLNENMRSAKMGVGGGTFEVHLSPAEVEAIEWLDAAITALHHQPNGREK